VTEPDDDLVGMLRENTPSSGGFTNLERLKRLNIRLDKLRREITQVEAQIARLASPRKSGRPKVYASGAEKQRAYRQRGNVEEKRRKDAARKRASWQRKKWA
jgi:outer membrane murein-binding lipoprotein Lpp